MHSLREAGLLFLAAVAGGIINSVAGGGGFICFPALLFTGVPPISANATNTIALWPGTAASVVAYRKELRQQDRRTIVPLAISSIIGGLAGALLLLLTPQQTFLRMVPWLMLVATLLFVFGGKITELIRKRTGPPGHSGANAILTCSMARLTFNPPRALTTTGGRAPRWQSRSSSWRCRFTSATSVPAPAS